MRCWMFTLSGPKTHLSPVALCRGSQVEWSEICRAPQVERLVPVYHKTDVLGLQTFLLDKFVRWAGNGSCVEEICENNKEMVSESTEGFVQHKILQKKPVS